MLKENNRKYINKKIIASSTILIINIILFAIRWIRIQGSIYEILHNKIVYTLIMLVIVNICLIWLLPEVRIKNLACKELWTLVIVSIGYIIIETETGNLFQVKWNRIWVNIVYIFFFYKVIQSIINRDRIAKGITIVVCCLIGIAEYYVLEFRGTPITPWDLSVLNTALTVAGTYTFDISKKIIFGVDIAVLGLILNYKIHNTTVSTKKKTRVYNMGCAGVLCAIILVKIYPDQTISIWDQASEYASYGVTSSFISNMKYMIYKKPEDYSTEYAEQILEDTPAVKTEVETRATNILVIMNETFADLRVINNEKVSDDYMPFIDSLKENTVKGKLAVPVFGNGTCDTEFEVLTGTSTKYTGAYPYVTQIQKNLNSLAWTLSCEDYSTIAFHPYMSTNWNRNKVYPLLGFENFYDISVLGDYEPIRWTPSDEADYKEIIDLYETKQQSNMFIFNVTLQNHGGYDIEWDNFPSTVDLSDQGDFPQAEQYFSLIKESDKAIEELITYFEGIDEPTLICFFGDHQPNLETEYYQMLYDTDDLSCLSDEEIRLEYQIPFFIWTNYDIDEKEIDLISTNYLSSLILYYAGLDLEKYDAFNYRLSQEYPVVSRMGVMDTEGNICPDSVEDNERLKQYEILTYYRIKKALAG